MQKPKKIKKPCPSETSSMEGSSEGRDATKGWTVDEIALFKQLLETCGTDFSIIKPYFPRKSKNQLKVNGSVYRININNWWIRHIVKKFITAQKQRK